MEMSTIQIISKLKKQADTCKLPRLMVAHLWMSGYGIHKEGEKEQQ